ncbi:MAG: hypothetical protein ACLT5P_11010 [Flavonifractor plautii]
MVTTARTGRRGDGLASALMFRLTAAVPGWPPAADFEACAEGIAVLQVEEAHHVHRDIVLVYPESRS